MKLISVQSKGNRLATVLKQSEVEGVGGYTIQLKFLNKKEKRFKKAGFWHRYHKSGALQAAAEWLEGCKE